MTALPEHDQLAEVAGSGPSQPAHDARRAADQRRDRTRPRHGGLQLRGQVRGGGAEVGEPGVQVLPATGDAEAAAADRVGQRGPRAVVEELDDLEQVDAGAAARERDRAPLGHGVVDVAREQLEIREIDDRPHLHVRPCVLAERREIRAQLGGGQHVPVVRLHIGDQPREPPGDPDRVAALEDRGVGRDLDLDLVAALKRHAVHRRPRDPGHQRPDRRHAEAEQELAVLQAPGGSAHGPGKAAGRPHPVAHGPSRKSRRSSAAPRSGPPFPLPPPPPPPPLFATAVQDAADSAADLVQDLADALLGLVERVAERVVVAGAPPPAGGAAGAGPPPGALPAGLAPAARAGGVAAAVRRCPKARERRRSRGRGSRVRPAGRRPRS